MAGEGAKIAPLWRELWDLHEAWGSYPATQNGAEYTDVAKRIDLDTAARSGFPLLLKEASGAAHAHLVAVVDGEIVGQVEGWFERQGFHWSTPRTCEVRSLVVGPSARGLGVGRALIEELALVASLFPGNLASFGVAEVHAQNPYRAFYRKAGFTPVSWAAAVDGTAPVASASGGTATGGPPNVTDALQVRQARPEDAFAVAVLEAALASRRRAQRDERFDPPCGIEAVHLTALASYFAAPRPPESPEDLIVYSASTGRILGAASFVLIPLDSPFAAGTRAVLGRFALDPASEAKEVLAPLIHFAQARARDGGARWLELADLSAPGSPLFEGVRALGARPWSSVFGRKFAPSRGDAQK
jgi:GNAT superfamily N-acetyltransferase